jgi:hypothetical protein
MDLDFEDFLNSSKENCKTKNDFLHKIKREKKHIRESGEGNNPLERELYLSRLENAEFCTEKSAFKIKDKFNNLILSLLDLLK